jgi:hypothetical protein
VYRRGSCYRSRERRNPFGSVVRHKSPRNPKANLSGPEAGKVTPVAIVSTRGQFLLKHAVCPQTVLRQADHKSRRSVTVPPHTDRAPISNTGG